MKIVERFQRFLNPAIVICLGWCAFFGGILIEALEAPVVSLPLEAIARVLP